MKSLEFVLINDTKVTDAGLKHLKGLTRLKDLGLYNTKVTDAGFKKLRQALPNCRIGRWSKIE